MKLFKVTETYNKKEGTYGREYFFSSRSLAKKWILELEKIQQEAKDSAIAESNKLMIQAMNGNDSSAIKYLESLANGVGHFHIRMTEIHVQGPDWKKVAISLWDRFDEYERVITDFGILAVTSATWPEGELKEKFRKDNPDQPLFEEVELFVE